MVRHELKQLLSKKEVEEYVVQMLSRGQKMTTKQIMEISTKDGVSCGDEPVRVLTKLRSRGVIKGQLSLRHRGWLWWI